MKHNRRTFLIHVAETLSVLATSPLALAQGPALLPESDTQAMALGYKNDATKVDKSKFPKYAAGQTCSSCQLYQGKATDSAGPCTLFPNKLVASQGWCSAWVKKA